MAARECILRPFVSKCPHANIRVCSRPPQSVSCPGRHAEAVDPVAPASLRASNLSAPSSQHPSLFPSLVHARLRSKQIFRNIQSAPGGVTSVSA